MNSQELGVFLESVADFVETNMYIFALISILSNSFHLVVLLKKSISSSAVTSLLIAIAVVEIISPMYYVKRGVKALIYRGACIPARGYSEAVTNWVLLALRDDFRRCSTWFGLDLVVIRMFALKLAMKKNFKFILDAPFGFKVILGTLLLSSTISIFYLFRYQIVPDDTWKPLAGCPMYPIQYVVDELETAGHAREAHLLVTAIFEKILPSILFPLVAVVLIYELRKASRMGKTINPTGNSAASKINGKTNKLVICMAISFVVIEFPIGVCKLITAAHESYDDALVSESIAALLNMIYVPMTATHCFICFTMSSQYRKTVRILLRLEKKNTKKHSVKSAVSVGPI